MAWSVPGRDARIQGLAAVFATIIAAGVISPPSPVSAVRQEQQEQIDPGPSVAGVVRIVTRSTRRLASAGAYPGRTVAIPTAHDPSELGNVLVFVNVPPRPTPPTTAVIRQTGEQFVPHLVAVTAGSTVQFPNDDLLFHNVFSLSRAAVFDLGRYPRGRSKSRKFDAPGIVKVYCHLHSHMNALIRVFGHPYFTIPGPDGRFAISGLPPGSYDVVAWHERVGDVTMRAVVAPGRPAELSFSLPLTEDE